jgi:ankyrin repeat protein
MLIKQHQQARQVMFFFLFFSHSKLLINLALAYACESGHTEVAEILLNSGAHIDQTENEGRTPLMKAARAGHICTIRYLITKG